MIEFIKQYWLQVLFGSIVTILSASIRHLYNGLKKERKERNNRSEKESREQALLKEGVLALLHDRIFQACQCHIKNGYITIQDLNNLEYLYKGYRGLGGNGTGEELYKRSRSLRIVSNDPIPSEE